MVITIPSCKNAARSPTISAVIVICSNVSACMNTSWSLSTYKNVHSFSSRITRSTVSDDRKRSFNFVPSRMSRSSIWAKAPPLPGFTCDTFTAVHSRPLCSITLPGLTALPLSFMRPILVSVTNCSHTYRQLACSSINSCASRRRYPASGRKSPTHCHTMTAPALTVYWQHWFVSNRQLKNGGHG